VEILLWLVGIATIAFAVVGLLRSLFRAPDRDSQETYARIEKARIATKTAAKEAAQDAAARVRREFP
jgi:hypothetical protein